MNIWNADLASYLTVIKSPHVDPDGISATVLFKYKTPVLALLHEAKVADVVISPPNIKV